MDLLTHTLVDNPALIEDAHINFSLRSLETREAILLDHTEDVFETAFGQYFSFFGVNSSRTVCALCIC